METSHGNVTTEMQRASARQEAATSAVEECQRVMRVANPALGVMSAVTFYPGFSGLEDRFTPWLHRFFRQEILPRLVEAVHWGSEEMGRELLLCDGTILQNSSELHRNGSRKAGRLLLREGVPTGVKCLQPLQKAVVAGQATAHLATVFGARCGVFSIGQQAAALSYIYLELRTGAPDWNDLQIEEKLFEAAKVIGAFFEQKMQSTESKIAISVRRRSHG